LKTYDPATSTWTSLASPLEVSNTTGKISVTGLYTTSGGIILVGWASQTLSSSFNFMGNLNLPSQTATGQSQAFFFYYVSGTWYGGMIPTVSGQTASQATGVTLDNFNNIFLISGSITTPSSTFWAMWKLPGSAMDSPSGLAGSISSIWINGVGSSTDSANSIFADSNHHLMGGSKSGWAIDDYTTATWPSPTAVSSESFLSISGSSGTVNSIISDGTNYYAVGTWNNAYKVSTCLNCAGGTPNNPPWADLDNGPSGSSAVQAVYISSAATSINPGLYVLGQETSQDQMVDYLRYYPNGTGGPVRIDLFTTSNNPTALGTNTLATGLVAASNQIWYGAMGQVTNTTGDPDYWFLRGATFTNTAWPTQPILQNP